MDVEVLAWYSCRFFSSLVAVQKQGSQGECEHAVSAGPGYTPGFHGYP